MLNITDSQKKIRDFYTKYYDENWDYPTYETAWKYLWMTPAWVFKNIKWLESQNVLTRNHSWQITRTNDSQRVEIAWTISCWYWIEISDVDTTGEYIEVPTSILPKNIPWYVLKAQWDSMNDAGIFDWDYLVIKYQTYANDWDIVVAILKGDFNEQATLKQFYRTAKSVLLKPKNSKYEPIVIDENHPWEIRWKLVWILRKFW